MTVTYFALSDLKISVQRNSIRRLIFGGVGLIAVIAVGTAVMVGNFRERALSSSERELANTVLLLANHLDQQFEEFEVVQKDLIAHLSLTGVASREDFKRQMSSHDMHEILKAKSNGSFDVAGVNIFDADGTLVNSSKAWPLPTVSIADRSYFITLKSGSASTPVLMIELLQSRLSGSGWTVLIARKITGANGEFLGLVTRGIATANFEKFFAPLALGDDAVISMLHRDGTMLARYPHIDSLIGKNFSDGPFFRILSNAEHGSGRKTSREDGRERLGSVRQLSGFPIVVVATTSVSAALTDWRAQTRLLIGVAGLLVLVIAVMLFLIVRQLSRQHEASQRGLAVEKQRLDTAINNMAQGLLLFDSSNRLIVCNRRYLEMFDGSSDVVKPGCTIRDLLQHRKESGAFNGDVDQYCTILLNSLAHGKVIQTIFNMADGRSIQILHQPLAEGGWVTTMEDITERRRSEERITHLAHYDALTDLPNRVLFHEHLEAELAGIHAGEQLAVLYLDIDEFKSINDSLGHRIGDELLKAVAASLSGCLGKTDFVARLGGDEFAIIQAGIKDPENVVDLVTRIYRAIREPYECLGHQVMTDASIGIALVPKDGTDLDQILQNADLAMYSAKADGRRTYRFFESDMDARVKARRSLEMGLRQAILDGEFEVHYQPIVDLRSNQISCCEALLRWRHPERGMISPAEFIPVAEETGLINQLGEWVLATACAEAATWPAGIKLAVNVSPVQFRSDTLALKVIAVLAASGLSASRLELEITEAVLIRDDAAALAILHQLRALGVGIALDDFGTGYSSLSYLQRFPFDKIKIDRCFIKDIAESGGSPCIVRAVVDIAATRHIKTTAEGVETEQQRDLLRTLGCTEMQGYLFSPARPAAELKRLFFAQSKRTAAVA
jgi:diguanylate cyclase (GGDEF)-like protein